MGCRKFSRQAYINHGFTLIELIITIAVAAILASVAAPSMREGILNGKTKALSLEFTAALGLAQSEAIKRGVQVSIDPMQTTTLTPGTQWQTGWNLFADPDGDGTLDAGEELIQTYSMDDNGLTLVSRDAVFSDWLAFLPSGATRGNGGISGAFRICRADNNLDKSRQVTVQSSGNIIVDKGTQSCP